MTARAMSRGPCRTCCEAPTVSFRPVDVKLGPDGALYIADWSNPIINHGEVDFRDPRRDHEHGRIWRVTAKGRPLNPSLNLTAMPTRELFNSLLSADSFERTQARRVLIERGPDVLRELPECKSDEARLEALLASSCVRRRRSKTIADRAGIDRPTGSGGRRSRAW